MVQQDRSLAAVLAAAAAVTVNELWLESRQEIRIPLQSAPEVMAEVLSVLREMPETIRHSLVTLVERRPVMAVVPEAD